MHRILFTPDALFIPKSSLPMNGSSHRPGVKVHRNKQDNQPICMSAARVPIVPRLVGSLDTFTVSQVDSFIAIRRVINLEIIW